MGDAIKSTICIILACFSLNAFASSKPHQSFLNEDSIRNFFKSPMPFVNLTGGYGTFENAASGTAATATGKVAIGSMAINLF